MRPKRSRRKRFKANPRRYDPSLERQKLGQRLKESSRIAEAFCEHDPLLRASLEHLRPRCGKERCRCQRGQLHESLVLVDRSSGQRQIRKVEPQELKALRQLTRKYQALRRLRVRLSRLHSEILELCDRLLVCRGRDVDLSRGAAAARSSCRHDGTAHDGPRARATRALTANLRVLSTLAPA